MTRTAFARKTFSKASLIQVSTAAKWSPRRSPPFSEGQIKPQQGYGPRYSFCPRIQAPTARCKRLTPRLRQPLVPSSQTTMAKSLPYLQACIEEGLRLWPPSMGLMGKVSDQDDVVCRMKVRAGTQVGWAALAVMKDRAVFGENADVFEPRRWIDAEPAQLKEMEATYGLVLAAGTRWECLGKRLAYVELGKVLFEVSTLSCCPS